MCIHIVPARGAVMEKSETKNGCSAHGVTSFTLCNVRFTGHLFARTILTHDNEPTYR
jgi:hypothetical protein